MKRELILGLISVALYYSANAGIQYGAITGDMDISPGSMPVQSYAAVNGHGSVLQNYTLTFTFTGNNDVSKITGALTLDLPSGTAVQLLNLGSGGGFSVSPTNAMTYKRTFDPSTFSPAPSPIYNPNNTWAWDLHTSSPIGSDITFVGWSLEVTAVPEPANVALGIFAGIFVLGSLSRTQRVRGQIRRWRAAALRWVDAV